MPCSKVIMFRNSTNIHIISNHDCNYNRLNVLTLQTEGRPCLEANEGHSLVHVCALCVQALTCKGVAQHRAVLIHKPMSGLILSLNESTLQFVTSYA